MAARTTVFRGVVFPAVELTIHEPQPAPQVAGSCGRRITPSTVIARSQASSTGSREQQVGGVEVADHGHPAVGQTHASSSGRPPPAQRARAPARRPHPAVDRHRLGNGHHSPAAVGQPPAELEVLPEAEVVLGPRPAVAVGHPLEGRPPVHRQRAARRQHLPGRHQVIGQPARRSRDRATSRVRPVEHLADAVHGDAVGPHQTRCRAGDVGLIGHRGHRARSGSPVSPRRPG